eukprot:11191017-Lingulodinium_polyedra.AAC.1
MGPDGPSCFGLRSRRKAPGRATEGGRRHSGARIRGARAARPAVVAAASRRSGNPGATGCRTGREANR